MRHTIKTSYYAVLGVSSHASKDEIKSAYRVLARQTHPDAGGDPDRFAQIAKAWEVLGNDQERELYDAERSLQARAARPYTTAFDDAGGSAPSAARTHRSPSDDQLSDTQRWMRNKRRF